MRFGRFAVKSDYFFNDTEKLAAIFQRMGLVPVRVEHLFAESMFQYVAVSHMFREVSQGHLLPEYLVVIHQDATDFWVEVREVPDASAAPRVAGERYLDVY